MKSGPADARRVATRATAPAAATRGPVLHAWIAAILIAMAVATAHGPVLGTTAISADDDTFVTNNPLVTNPSPAAVARFFGEVLSPSTVPGYYLPVTMTSLMLDYAAGARTERPRVFHVTSLALHVAVVLLVYLLLLRAVGAVLPAALAALAFGLHPLTVEPVAWISERKTLLVSLFALGSVLAYVESARRRTPLLRVASLALFALALLSKPSATSLPLLLLALDGWPLRRLDRAAWLEKWPYAVLAAASAVISVVSLTRTDVIARLPLTPLDWVWRTGYLVGFYLGRAVWPVSLSVVYPPPAPFSPAHPAVLAGLAAVAVLTVSAFALRRRFPAGWTAWLFVILTLAPTFGVVAWSRQVAWDRYFYLSAVGLALAGAAGFASLWTRLGRTGRAAALAGVTALLVAEGVATRVALRAWTDSVSLWRNAVAVAPGEPSAHNGLGMALGRGGDFEAAAAEFRRALELERDYPMSQRNLGRALLSLGRLEEAGRELRRAAATSPPNADVQYDLGCVAHGLGQPDSAAAHFQRALALDPQRADAALQLGIVHGERGRIAECTAWMRRAVQLAPAHPGARLGLAMALLKSGGADREAIANLRATLALKPDWLGPLQTLAWLLATHPQAALRDPGEAVLLAERLVELTGGREGRAFDTRAAARAAAGRFAEAQADAERAIRLAEAAGDDSLASRVRERLTQYQRGVAHTEPVTAGF